MTLMHLFLKLKNELKCKNMSCAISLVKLKMYISFFYYV